MRCATSIYYRCTSALWTSSCQLHHAQRTFLWLLVHASLSFHVDLFKQLGLGLSVLKPPVYVKPLLKFGLCQIYLDFASSYRPRESFVVFFLMSSGAQGSSGSAGPSTENAGRESSSPNPASQIEDFAHQHAPLDTSGSAPKKKKHRAGKKRRNRRQSFAAPSDQTDDTDLQDQRPTLHTVPEGSQAQSTFYRLGARAGRSNTSLESEALLDHR